VTDTALDERFMALALSLGRRGQGRVWPNPAVGCVIVKHGRVIGRGWTQPGGRPHAETHALQQAGAAARGATAYVTLEPCAHHGHTPPCADALITAGLARVVTALHDPDPRVDGGGHARLEDAGITVSKHVLAGKAQLDHAGFLSRVQTGRPVFTLKLANSFDGRIATATGDSQWITGPAARRLVHGFRARHDAVLVGAGTARIDDPSLTVRGLGIDHQPVRVVLSRRLDLPTESKLAMTARDAPLWLCHGSDADPEKVQQWQSLGARTLECKVGAGRQLDLLSVAQVLGAEGLTRVFCEGGGMLAASMLAQGIVDQLIGFTAGVVIGAEGQPSLGAMGIDVLAEAPRFTLFETHAVEGDVLHVWRRAPSP
jgi:diaminohydroxyphosphoribosylaminopyrimidine deaminase/5-amino-6-(5-phosphoribosylamino)uracil reductase